MVRWQRMEWLVRSDVGGRVLASRHPYLDIDKFSCIRLSENANAWRGSRKPSLEFPVLEFSPISVRGLGDVCAMLNAAPTVRKGSRSASADSSVDVSHHCDNNGRSVAIASKQTEALGSRSPLSTGQMKRSAVALGSPYD